MTAKYLMTVLKNNNKR